MIVGRKALSTHGSKKKQEEAPQTISGWLAANAVVALTVTGAVLYGILRLGHQTFYRQFGLTPEEVGLGYGEALARAAGYLVYLFVSLLFGIATLSVIAYRSRQPISAVASRTGVLSVLVVVALFAILFSYSWLQADLWADEVKRGNAVRPFFLQDIGIRVERAKIAWNDGAPDSLDDLPTHNLMLLGQSGSLVIVYDVDDKRTVEIPSSLVTVSISP